MRETLEDLIRRLLSVQESLGDEAFQVACHRARHAIAFVAMQEAERTAGTTPTGREVLQLRTINHNGSE